MLSDLPEPTNDRRGEQLLSCCRTSTNDTDKAGGKVDFQVNPRLSAFGRFGWRDVDIFDNPPIPLPSGGGGNADTYARNKQFARRRRPTCRRGVVAARGALRLVEHRRRARTRPRSASASALDAYGITGLPTDPRVAGGLPTQLITGFTDLGRQATNPQWQYPTVFNPKVNYTWLAGRHSLKTGYEFQHIQTEVQDVNPLYGRDQLRRPVLAAGRRAAANNLYNLADFMFGAALAPTRSATSWSPTSRRTCTSPICRTTGASTTG